MARVPDRETGASPAKSTAENPAQRLGHVPAGPPALSGLIAMLLAVTGEDQGWARALTPQSRLEGDLALDSLELAALGGLLRDRYGPAADLPGYLATLDMDQLIGLTLADLLAYLAAPTSPEAARAEAG